MIFDIQTNLQKFNIDLNKPIKDLDIDCLRAIEKVIENKNKINKQNLIIVNNIDEKIKGKYDVLLEVLNKILVNIGNPKILQLTEFSKINREDIIKECNENIINEMEEVILEHYEKGNICWYQRKSIKHYILSFIRNACLILGYKFDYIKKSVVIKSNGINRTVTILLYSIEK